jgi:hypothetical protein
VAVIVETSVGDNVGVIVGMLVGVGVHVREAVGLGVEVVLGEGDGDGEPVSTGVAVMTTVYLTGDTIGTGVPRKTSAARLRTAAGVGSAPSARALSNSGNPAVPLRTTPTSNPIKAKSGSQRSNAFPARGVRTGAEG